MTYDSRDDTLAHIERVRHYLFLVRSHIRQREDDHDQTKLADPEKALFDEWTPKLKSLTYGSEEYKVALTELKPALDHHYAHNSHHPEHHENGVSGMNLLDVIEMLVDWKAASERHANGDIWKSLEINRERFNISEQLYSILINTAKELGW